MKHSSVSSPDLFLSLPETVLIDGKETEIRTDFRTAFRFMDYVEHSKDGDERFLGEVLRIWYPVVPENRAQALDEAIRFYCGGKEPDCGYYRPAVSPDGTRERLYLAFFRNYGMDLNRDKIHWWVFRKLLEDLKRKDDIR